MGRAQKTSNFNQALWLSIGQFSTFLISFVSAAILARYFNKQDYGTYKQVLYVYNTLSSLFIFGLPTIFGYLIPRLNAGEQKQLINSINRIFLYLGAAFSILLFACSNLIADILKNEDLGLALKIFSPFPLFTLPTLGVEGIYTALKKTKTIAIYSMVSRTLIFIFIVGPVILFHCSYIGALIGWGISNFLIFLMSLYLKRKPYVHVAPELIPNMYSTIYNFCLPLLGAFIGGFAINSASQFFISRYYGTAEFANFSNGCLSIPIAAIIATSVRNVLVPVISKAHSENNFDEIRGVYTRACSKSITLVFPILSYAIFFATPLMTFIYSSKYAISGQYLQMYLIRDFCSTFPYYSLLMAFGETKAYMNLHIFGAIYLWGIDSIGVFLFHVSPTILVLFDSCFYIICTIIVFIYMSRKNKLNLFGKQLILNIIKIIIQSLIVGLISFILICRLPIHQSFLQLFMGAIIFFLFLFGTGKLIGVDYLIVMRNIKLKKNGN